MSWWDKLFGRSQTGAVPATSNPRTPVLATVELPASEGPATAYGDQVLRKQWAEGVLKAQGVPINPHLPMIESEAEITLRSPQEVADRLLALALVAVKGEGMAHEEVLELAAERQAMVLFSPEERRFIETPEPTQLERIQFSWRYEAGWVLLWALKRLDEPLSYPRDVCHPGTLVREVSTTPDLADRGLKSANDILNQADLIYRYHWAVTQAGIDGVAPPAGLNPGVVMERHKALNWLIGYDDNAAWDDVGTDT